MPTKLQNPSMNLAMPSEMHRVEQGRPSEWTCEAQQEQPQLGELHAEVSLHLTQL